MDKIKLTIDGHCIETAPGSSLLEAALAADIYIPHLCHHPALKDVGDCKMCVVEIDGTEGPVTSCTTPAVDGMIVHTRTDRLKKARSLSMELMLAAHPSECTSCSKYLKCELQNLIQYLGVSDSRLRKLPMPHVVETENPLLVRDMNRCIQCGRCIRACRELRGCNVLAVLRDGEKTKVGPEHNGLLSDDKCRFCTACVEVCPTAALMDKAEWMDKFPTVEQNLLPCKASCPAGTDVPRYVRFIKEGRYSEAVAVIRQRAPMPMTLGFICTAFCESNCRRGAVNGAVAIRELKKRAALNDDGSWRKNLRMKPKTGRRVAVVGAGPAGLISAYYLAKQGHDVTIYERDAKPGGMLRVGIPEYRLPREVIDGEIDILLETGIQLVPNARIDTPATLLNMGFDAVVAAIGTHRGIRLPVEGKDLPGVLVNTDFLRRAALHDPIPVGERVVVLGGGNVAFDCARTALRLGAKEVVMACLESREKMTANEEEIREGTEEGIRILNSRTFLRIGDDDGRMGVLCDEVASFSFEKDGRLKLETVPDSRHFLEADTVIFAAGQIVDIPEGFGLETTRGNRIVVNEHATSMTGVFAAGDAVNGTSSVIQSIASGRGAASAVDRYLGGDGDIEEVLAPIEEPNPWLGEDGLFVGMERNHPFCRAADERSRDFADVVAPFPEETAVCEASRCMQCDLRLKIEKPRFYGDFAVK